MANNKHGNQKGIVSITVTIVLMLVISLIVLTFAKIIRREQRQALDRQLSTQAFYAAESGVNNVVSAIKDGFSDPIVNCGDSVAANKPGAAKINNRTINSTANVSVSCLTVNPTPDSLYYSSVDQTSTMIPIESNDGSAISSVYLEWQPKSTNSNPVTNCKLTNNFPANTSVDWTCPVGILRIDLVPTAGTFSRNGLNTSMLSAFLYPSGIGSGRAAFDYTEASGVTNQGAIIETLCSGSPAICKSTINGLSSSKYALRVRSLYVSSKLTIKANSGVNGVRLMNAQAIVDSTGKASDVLRRIQVRIPLTGAGNVPDFGIQTSTDICKRYLYIPGQDVIIDPTVAADPSCSIN